MCRPPAAWQAQQRAAPRAQAAAAAVGARSGRRRRRGAHRPDGIGFAASRHLDNQLHVGVVVAVGAARHADELVRQADVPARKRQRASAAAAARRAAASSRRHIGGAPRGAARSAAGPRGFCTRLPRAAPALARAAAAEVAVARATAGTHSALAATSSGVAMATKCSTPSRRNVWYAQRRIERMHLAAPTAGARGAERRDAQLSAAASGAIAARCGARTSVVGNQDLADGPRAAVRGHPVRILVGNTPHPGSCEAGARRGGVSCASARAGRRRRRRCARTRRRRAERGCGEAAKRAAAVGL